MSEREIWTYGDLRSARQWQASLKVLAKAIDLAAAAGASPGMVLIGGGAEAAQTPQAPAGACIALAEAAEQAAALGVQTVYCLEDPLLAVPRTDLYGRVLADFAQRRGPWLVLLPLTDFGREVAAIGAQRCQAGLIADCTELVFTAGLFVGRCPAWGGQIIADITLAEGWPTAFVTVQPHGAQVPAPRGERGRIERIAPEQIDSFPVVDLVRRSVQAAAARRLEDADIVVVGGAGLVDMRGFGLVRTLAAALGGEVGATRPPVMNHWVAAERLIGQTGKSVRPRLLISVGTSGALQYTAGIMEAETIVAINRDPAAPIFQLADVGIVADANTLLPLLNQRAQQSALRRLADATCDLSGDGNADDAVLRWVERKDDPTSRWAAGLKGRRHTNVAVVALANKIARIAYAVMTTGKPYDPTRGALANA
jgi:electron transfer flavoprotein alpha subunit